MFNELDDKATQVSDKIYCVIKTEEPNVAINGLIRCLVSYIGSCILQEENDNEFNSFERALKEVAKNIVISGKDLTKEIKADLKNNNQTLKGLMNEQKEETPKVSL